MQCFIVFCGLIAVLLPTLPIIDFLNRGLRERQEEILGYFESPSIRLWYEHYRHAEWERLPEDSDWPRILATFCEQRCGRWTYVVPLAIFGLALVSCIAIIAGYVLVFFDADLHPLEKIPLQAVLALAGAYMWVTFDVISRHRQRDIDPTALNWYAFRIFMAIPLAYACTALAKDVVALPLSFVLGAFPTNTLMLFLRRRGAQQLGLGDDSQTPHHELEILHGVNTTVAEKLSDLGITTVLRLAYEDPIELAMRTNLTFNFMLHIVSQALAAVYLNPIQTARKYAMRGAIEAYKLYEDIENGQPAAKARAEAAVRSFADEIRIPFDAVMLSLREIRTDPATAILKHVWDGTPITPPSEPRMPPGC
jgi:hypothetical protein